MLRHLATFNRFHTLNPHFTTTCLAQLNAEKALTPEILARILCETDYPAESAKLVTYLLGALSHQVMPYALSPLAENLLHNGYQWGIHQTEELAHELSDLVPATSWLWKEISDSKLHKHAAMNFTESLCVAARSTLHWPKPHPHSRHIGKAFSLGLEALTEARIFEEKLKRGMVAYSPNGVIEVKPDAKLTLFQPKLNPSAIKAELLESLVAFTTALLHQPEHARKTHAA